jgi:hypothetical protein
MKICLSEVNCMAVEETLRAIRAIWPYCRIKYIDFKRTSNRRGIPKFRVEAIVSKWGSGILSDNGFKVVIPEVGPYFSETGLQNSSFMRVYDPHCEYTVTFERDQIQVSSKQGGHEDTIT